MDPEAIVHLHSWNALVRLATSGSIGWYRAWAKGEWSSPDPVPLFALFMANAAASANWGGRRASRGVHLLEAPPPQERPRRRAREHRRALRPRQRLLLGLARPHDDLSSARFAKGDDLETGTGAQGRDAARSPRPRPEQRLLEIGCGWGSLAIAAASAAFRRRADPVDRAEAYGRSALEEGQVYRSR